MDRKINQSVKDFLVGMVAEETEIAEKTVDRVVMWAYKQAKEQTSNQANVELSGFGTIMVSQFKLKREIGRLEIRIADAKSKPSTLAGELSIERMERKSNYLKTKLRG